MKNKLIPRWGILQLEYNGLGDNIWEFTVYFVTSRKQARREVRTGNSHVCYHIMFDSWNPLGFNYAYNHAIRRLKRIGYGC